MKATQMDQSQAHISELLGVVASRFAALARAEMLVFGTEMRLKLAQGVTAGIWLAAAAFCLFAGLALALAALLLWLISLGMAPATAAAALALVIIGLGALALLKGLALLRAVSFLPERTLANMQLDAALLQRRGRNA